MKKLLPIFLSFIMVGGAWSEEIVPISAEPITPIGVDLAARANALETCSRVQDGIRSIMILGGVATGASAVGTVAGGVGVYAGIQARSYDEEFIAGLWTELPNQISALNTDINAVFPAAGPVDTVGNNAEQINRIATELPRLEGIVNGVGEDGQPPRTPPTVAQVEAALIQAGIEGHTNRYGRVRTVAAFTAGGANLVAAGSAIAGRVTVDFNQIVSDMEMCERTAQMTGDFNAMTVCTGFNRQNIETIRNNLTIAGVVSVVGTAAGVYGGIRSRQAGPENMHLHTHATVATGIAGGAALASGLITGIPLLNLRRNAQIAAECVRALQ